VVFYPLFLEIEAEQRRKHLLRPPIHSVAARNGVVRRTLASAFATWISRGRPEELVPIQRRGRQNGALTKDEDVEEQSLADLLKDLASDGQLIDGPVIRSYAVDIWKQRNVHWTRTSSSRQR
jgi:hypothetical protein